MVEYLGPKKSSHINRGGRGDYARVDHFQQIFIAELLICESYDDWFLAVALKRLIKVLETLIVNREWIYKDCFATQVIQIRNRRSAWTANDDLGYVTGNRRGKSDFLLAHRCDGNGNGN